MVQLRPVFKTVITITVVLVVVALPTLWVDIPAMTDYPNHLARMYLLVSNGTATQNPYYDVTWGFYPNLAMDVLVPLLAHLVSVELATKFFYIFSAVLVVTGSLAIEYQVKREIKLSPFTSPMFLNSWPFALGFLNFEFGLGLALWGVATWLLLKDRGWSIRLFVHSVLVVLLFGAHFFALGIYGLTIGLYEMWRFASKQLSIRRTVVTLAAMAAPTLVLLGTMMVAGGRIGDTSTIIWDWPVKGLAIIHLISGYSFTLSLISFALLHTFTVIDRKHMAFMDAGAWVFAGLAIVFLAMPTGLLGTAYLVDRVLLAAGLIVPAFISITNNAASRRLALVVCAITLTSFLHASYVWISYAQTYSALKESFVRLEKGARILVAHGGFEKTLVDYPIFVRLEKGASMLVAHGLESPFVDYPIHHAPTLAVRYANAFVATLFAAPGKQPIVVRTEFRDLLAPQIELPSYTALEDIANGGLESGPRYLRNWQHQFDYLYVVGQRNRRLIPDFLDEIETAAGFTLYKIRNDRSNWLPGSRRD